VQADPRSADLFECHRALIEFDKKEDRNGQMSDDTSGLSATAVDSLLFEARLKKSKRSRDFTYTSFRNGQPSGGMVCLKNVIDGTSFNLSW
jgi:hypothetical protein